MSGLRRITHAVPGEHYFAIRPLRDDLRRTVVETPRRGRRTRARRHREERRKLAKKTNKMLLKDTHRGRPAKTQARSSRAPSTMSARQPNKQSRNPVVAHAHQARKVSRSASPKRATADLGIKVHKPRLLSPHHPYAYHVFPIQRIYRHLSR